MSKLSQISKMTIERYSKRFEQLGYDVHTLGWGSVEQQRYRFSETLCMNFDIKNLTLFDIGCGFGDYFDFLCENNKKPLKYRGFDINDDLLVEAEKRHSHFENVSFDRLDLTCGSNHDKADIVLMLGVLNFNLKEKYSNYEYSYNMIKNAFEMTEKVLIVDFLSTKLDKNYPKEDFVFYHDPVKMVEFAFTLSDNVVLKHNYASIPQKEFMLFIYK